MWLGGIFGLAIVTYLGFEVDFYVWLGVFTTLLAATSYAITRNRVIIKCFFPAAFTTAISLTVVPFLLTDINLSENELKYAYWFFNGTPVFAAVISLMASTVIGIFNPRTVGS